MDYSKELEIAYQLVDSDKYLEALAYIEGVRKAGCDDVILYLYEALCAYEANDDLETLRLLTEFLSKAGDHIKREYALFTFATSLMNLGLPNEALSIFNLVSDSYPNINKERISAKKDKKLQESSLLYYSNILGRLDA